ncbi:MAG: DUF4230 domain-containing protein [Acidimicrobiales bacterium]
MAAVALSSPRCWPAGGHRSGPTRSIDRRPSCSTSCRTSAATAATGEFSELVDVEDDVRYVPDFLAGERTVMVAVGSVDAEVDFSRLDGSHIVVSEDGRSVVVHLPPTGCAARSST